MSSTSAPRTLAEPRWLERWRTQRAGRRDRVRFRGLPFDVHTPWTRELHARYLGLALEARQLVFDRRLALEQERDRLLVVLGLGRPSTPAERPAEPSEPLDRHLWALQARRDAEDLERHRAAETRSKTIDAELKRLGERVAHVTSVHEQAYLQRIHLYNGARATARSAATASQPVPPLELSPVVATEQPHLFPYAIAA